MKIAIKENFKRKNIIFFIQIVILKSKIGAASMVSLCYAEKGLYRTSHLVIFKRKNWESLRCGKYFFLVRSFSGNLPFLREKCCFGFFL